ncbi:MAG: hypothetical protein LBS92_02650 [Candidatus Methanoplasma sp.]|jgi:uncharacterized protein YwgA|nr:hypothetical protein [Candidatus Methanoplasma sp.]
MTEKCERCDWKRQDRTPEGTGLSYHYYQCDSCHDVAYPMDQLQKLMEYAESNQFMFVEDWILALFFALPDSYIVGRTSLQKQMFLIVYEFAPKENIPSENPGFRAYKYGPFADRIADATEVLIRDGLVIKNGRKDSGNERLELTENGKSFAKTAFDKLTDEQKTKLIDLRKEYQQWGLDGLLKHVYTYYGEYTGESKIRNKVLNLKN